MRTPVLVIAAVAVALIAGCGSGETAAPATVTVTAEPTLAPVAAAPTSTEAPVTQLTVPDVEGKNGAVAIDELERLGFTNVQPASRDEEDKVVILPENWTVTSIEPGAGEEASSDSVVVVTMTKK